MRFWPRLGRLRFWLASGRKTLATSKIRHGAQKNSTVQPAQHEKATLLLRFAFRKPFVQKEHVERAAGE